MRAHPLLSLLLVAGSVTSAVAVHGLVAAAPAEAAATSTYTVRSGDTLSSIARRFGTTVTRLMQLNRLSDPNTLRVGQVLVVSGTPAKPSVYAPGTSISAATSRQVLVADRSSGSYGSYVRYEWRGASTGWVKVGGSPARFGRGGVKPGSTRIAGDGSTPAGTYPILSTFGVGNPGTKMPYRTVTGCSWWSEKPATFNRFVEQCRHNSGEHLADYTTNRAKQYLQTAFIGFNAGPRPVLTGRGSGSAIFLHHSSTATAGCVGVTNRAEMNATVRWLDPAKNPQIVIKS